MAVENRGPELQAVGYILITTALITLLLRAYVRVFLVKSFGFDDWAMVVAMIFFSLFVTCALIGVHYGTGRHRKDLDEDDFEKAMMYWWFCYMWYCCSMVASKISIGWFLLRITVRKTDIITIYLVLICTAVTGAVFFFVTLFQCNPQSYFWNTNQDGYCINVDIIIALTYLYSAVSLICDFTFALLPVVLIMNLNLKRSFKMVLIPIVLMACVASTAVLVRFAYVKDFKDPDFLWATIDIALWSTTEQGLAITAGCLATLRPLFRIIASKMGTITGRSSIVPRPSGNQYPPTIGQAGSDKRDRPHGPFSLITVQETKNERARRESLDIEMSAPAGAPEMTTSFWTTTAHAGDAGSEEELTFDSKIAWGQQQGKTITTCTPGRI